MTFLIILTIAVVIALVSASAHTIANENRAAIADLHWRISEMEEKL